MMELYGTGNSKLLRAGSESVTVSRRLFTDAAASTCRWNKTFSHGAIKVTFLSNDARSEEGTSPLNEREFRAARGI